MFIQGGIQMKNLLIVLFVIFILTFTMVGFNKITKNEDNIIQNSDEFSISTSYIHL